MTLLFAISFVAFFYYADLRVDARLQLTCILISYELLDAARLVAGRSARMTLLVAISFAAFSYCSDLRVGARFISHDLLVMHDGAVVPPDHPAAVELLDAARALSLEGALG